MSNSTPQPHESATPTASPKLAANLMIATYVLGAVGLFVGFASVTGDPPSLTWATLLILGGAGGLSFLRHSVFHRSDAARMGWHSTGKNYFQIEVGIANAAWALVGVAAVVFGWGIVAEATAILVFGVYLTITALMLTLDRAAARKWPQVIGMATFGVMQIILAGIALM